MKTELGFIGAIAIVLSALTLWGTSPVPSPDDSQHATQIIVAAGTPATTFTMASGRASAAVHPSPAQSRLFSNESPHLKSHKKYYMAACMATGEECGKNEDCCDALCTDGICGGMMRRLGFFITPPSDIARTLLE